MPAPKKTRPGGSSSRPRKTPSTADSPIHAVLGTDEAQVKEAALKVAEKLTPPDNPDFGLEVIDGMAENADHAGRICAETIQALQTLPFFGGAKTVWLRNANFCGDTVTGRAAAAQDGLASLLEILQHGLAPDVRFILSASDVDKRRTFYKGIAAIAAVQVFDRPEPGGEGWEAAAADLITRRARELGLSFSRDALDLFIAMAGEETQALLNELEKLDLYLGPERRTAEPHDVREVVSLGRSGVVFEIGSAIGRRRLPEALALVDHFLERGENAIGILYAAIVPKVRSLFLAKYFAEDHGVSASGYGAYASQIGKLPDRATAFVPRTKKDNRPSVYPIFLAAQEARAFTMAELRAGLDACLEANRRLVQTSLPHPVVLSQLLAALLAPAPKRARRRSA